MKFETIAHFCDDIRHEVTGKYSLIGVYGGEMQVAQLPATIPQLVIVGYAGLPIDDLPKSIKFKISSDGITLQEAEIPSEQIPINAELIRARGSDSEPIERMMFAITVIISPFIIEKEKIVRTDFVVDGHEECAGKLRIRLAPPLTA